MQYLFSTHTQLTVVEGQNIFNYYKVIDKLGTGNNTVYSVLKDGDNIELAMKEIVIKSEQNLKDFMMEVNLMKQISIHKHPNLIGFHDFCILLRQREFEDLRLGYMLLEKALTSLDKLISQRQKKNHYYSTQLIKKFLKKSIEVHKFLQDQKIAHCDIKPENVLITDEITLKFKICDIGSGKLIKHENTSTATISGTIPFLAPELMSHFSCSKINHNPFKSDVFSLGLCVLNLVTFNKFTQVQRSTLSEAPFQDILKQWIHTAIVICDNDPLIQKLLTQMLIFDQNIRPDFKMLHEIMIEATLMEQEEIFILMKSKSDSPALQIEESMNNFTVFETPLAKSTKYMSKTRSNFAKPLKNSTSSVNVLLKSTESGSIFRIQQVNYLNKQSNNLKLEMDKPLAQHLPQIKQSMGSSYLNTDSPSTGKKIRTKTNSSQGPIRTIMNEDHNQVPLFNCPMQTSQLIDSGTVRQIRRKGNSNANIKLVPLEVQSAKSSFASESPMKKKQSPTIINSNQILIVTDHEGLKRFIEHYEGWNYDQDPKLILHLKQGQSTKSSLKSSDAVMTLNDLKKLSSIKDLSVVLVNNDEQWNILQNLVQVLKSFDSLENLELNLTDQVVSGEFPKLTMDKLQTLTIKLNNCQIISNGLISFIACLVHNNHQHLTLHFNQTQVDVGSLMDLLIKSQKLCFIDLAFMHATLDDKQHKKIYEVLSQCCALRTLIIHFYCCQLSLKREQWVFNSNLLQVVLKYEKSQIEKALTSLALGLQQLSKLLSLEINLSYIQTKPKLLKLFFEYVRKLITLKELRLNLDGVTLTQSDFDNSIIQIMVEKLKEVINLEVFQFSCMQAKLNNQSIETLFSLVGTPSSFNKLCQFEIIIPRIQSIKSIIDLCPIGMEIKSTFIDVDNIRVTLFNYDLINSRLEYHTQKLSIFNHCSENDYFPLFQCLSCEGVPAFNPNLCLQCAQSCHFGHKVVYSQVIPRITGQFSKLSQCECYFDGCTTSKKSACSNTFGCSTKHETQFIFMISQDVIVVICNQFVNSVQGVPTVVIHLNQEATLKPSNVVIDIVCNLIKYNLQQN